MATCGLSAASLQSEVYLITYSRADLVSFPTREVFADAVLEAWDKTCKSKVLHWVVSKEQHGDSDNSNRFHSQFHYHMALKLDKKSHWLRARNYLETTSGIKVNFSDHHPNYYSAYQDVTKEDEHSLHSPDHPPLSDVSAPRTTNASVTVRKNRGKKTGSKRSRTKRLSVYDVTEIVRREGITTRVQLLAYAERQRREGKTNLSEFITNRGSKVVNDALLLARVF